MTNDTFQLDDLPQPVKETTVPTDQLETDGDNPNEQSDEMFGLLKENMRKHGWIGNAIVCDTDYTIADGEHRWRAAQEIGLSEVPVKAYDIDDPTRRLWRQELNKISGEHDTKRDALEYDYLLDNGKSEEVTELVDAAGEDLDELLKEIRVDVSSPVAYDYGVDHNVYFEDCVEGMQKHLEDDSVDMVFTSPPYNVGKSQSQQRGTETDDYSDDRSPEEFREFIGSVFEELRRVTKPSGHIFVNLDPAYTGEIERHDWVHDLMGLPHRSTIIWYKNDYHRPYLPQNGQFQRDYEPIYHYSENPEPLETPKAPSVWETNSARLDDGYDTHPAPFSVPLVEKALDHTTTEGDSILDPFMGSGTTAVAAIQNDRNYVGFELDEEGAYKPIIERRIREATRAKDASVNQAEADD